MIERAVRVPGRGWPGSVYGPRLLSIWIYNVDRHHCPVPFSPLSPLRIITTRRLFFVFPAPGLAYSP